MSDFNTERLEPSQIEQLSFGSFAFEVVRGVGEALVLGAVLWPMEVVRDIYFRVLDRLGVPHRKRHRASAFPPGPSRRRRAN